MLRKLLIIALLFSSGKMFGQAQITKVEKTDYKQIGAPLPPLMVVTTDGKTITNKDVKYKANLFVMLFNPTCSHCEDETELLEHNIALFKNTKILMVANNMMGPYLSQFENSFHTKQYAHTMMVGLDSMHLIDKTFLYKSLPQINVYDKDRKLIKVFTGDTPIDSLKAYIE